MCLRTERMPEAKDIFGEEAVGQVYNQMNEFVYLGRNVNQKSDMFIEVDRRICIAW